MLSERTGLTSHTRTREQSRSISTEMKSPEEKSITINRARSCNCSLSNFYSDWNHGRRFRAFCVVVFQTLIQYTTQKINRFVDIQILISYAKSVWWLVLYSGCVRPIKRALEFNILYAPPTRGHVLLYSSSSLAIIMARRVTDWSECGVFLFKVKQTWTKTRTT